MEFIERLKKIENIVEKNNDRLGKISNNLINKYSLSSSEKLQNDIKEISDTERLMKIGIVGRVKAGKSSLLNAIVFDGKNVLPKAATPMTAALTELSYGDKYEAEVEFFTQEDINNIAKEAIEYDDKLKRELLIAIEDAKMKPKYKKATDKEIEEIVKPRVIRALADTNLAASKDQYERIMRSGLDAKGLNNQVINFESLDTLQKELVDFVGSNGKYMPFTKSVKIKFPLESLKDVNIVDTPGVNDPVVSREQRTKDELGKCDVIFIVSPAGQFLSSEDLELMDRITQKNGVRELFVVASKADTQFHGSIRDESNGVLKVAFEKLMYALGSQLYSTLTNLKNDHPEIGDTFDSLISNGKNSILHSSGIAFTIKENLNDLSKLDEGELHAWNLLKENYPDNFSDKNIDLSIASLDELSNINKIKEILNNTSKRKEDIMKNKINDFISQKTSLVIEYKEDLIKYLEESENEIKSSDIEELKNEQKKINEIKDNSIITLDSSFSNIIGDFEITLSRELKIRLNEIYRTAARGVVESETTETRTESYTVSDAKWYNPFSWFSEHTEYEHYDVTVVRTGAVKGILQSYIVDIESNISLKAKELVQNFRKSIPTILIRDLRESIDDDAINTSKLRQIINSVVNKIDLPELNYGDRRYPSGSGTLEGNRAGQFIEECSLFVDDIKNTINREIDLHTKKLINNLKDVNLGKDLFAEYDEQIEKLKSDIENKALTLDEISRIKKEIMNI
ncbi:dynamin family protein [Brachyspira pulli]|uniref:dynamin family protein n=1 Tax=Brachyspira pulli TaxID=310721 RepID=UPI0030049576